MPIPASVRQWRDELKRRKIARKEARKEDVYGFCYKIAVALKDGSVAENEYASYAALESYLPQYRHGMARSAAEQSLKDMQIKNLILVDDGSYVNVADVKNIVLYKRFFKISMNKSDLNYWHIPDVELKNKEYVSDWMPIDQEFHIEGIM